MKSSNTIIHFSLCNLEYLKCINTGVDQKKRKRETRFIMTSSDNKGINQRQNSYSQEDLKNILNDYKVNDKFTHPDFTEKELKKFIRQTTKSKFRSLKDCRIQWDYDKYKWKWMRETSTLESFI